MRGLIFGNGFIGNKLAQRFGLTVISKRLTCEDDIKHELTVNRPDVVINAIGRTGRPNIDWCETNKHETFESNVLVPLHLAEETQKRGIFMVHIGTGCVYSGDNGGQGFTEEDKPTEFSYYTRTKILAENALKEFDNVIQLRIRLPLDDKPHPRNLIDKLAKYKEIVSTQESITYIPTFLSAFEALVNKEKRGIYNIVNPGTISPYELMVAYYEEVKPKHEFKSIDLDRLQSIVVAKRSSCKLSSEKLIKDSGLDIPNINEVVDACIWTYVSEKESVNGL